MVVMRTLSSAGSSTILLWSWAVALGGVSRRVQGATTTPPPPPPPPPPNQQKKQKTPIDFLVQGLDEVEPAYQAFAGDMYAGLIPVRNGARHGETMFWMFEPHTPSHPDTLVIWLNGGPGCSSFNCGVLMEHSPVTQPLHAAGYCCLQSNPQFQVNKHAWTRATTVLYVEHPIGTGFSFGDEPATEYQASADFYVFLQNWLDIFVHLRSYQIYIMGESYAGMFVPSIGHTIYKQNAKLDDNNSRKINLGGVAIGNGWMNAAVQGPAVIDYSWWHGLIDEPTRHALHNAWKNCLDLGADKHPKQTSRSDHPPLPQPASLLPPPFHPFNVQDDCGMMWGVLAAAGQPNAYDITTWDPNVDQVTFSSEAFYNLPAVKAALHAPTNITWHGCKVGEGRRRRRQRRLEAAAEEEESPLFSSHGRQLLYMENDKPVNVVPYVAQLLDAGIRVVVYNGDRDMTTNMVGTELLLNDMEWSGKRQWLDATRGLWRVDGYPAGWAKEHKSLSYVVVYNSGHMVPYNQPGPAFDLLRRLLEQESFVDQELPTIRVQRDNEQEMHNVDDTDDRFRTANHRHHHHNNRRAEQWLAYAVTAVISFLAGVGFVHAKKLEASRRLPRDGGYHPVPDIAVSLHESGLNARKIRMVPDEQQGSFNNKHAAF